MTKKKRNKIKKELLEMIDSFDYEYLVEFSKGALGSSIDTTKDEDLEVYYNQLKKIWKEK